MKQNIIETLVGFVVIITALVFLTFAYNIGHDSKPDGYYSLKARFENSEGITSGSDVMISGIKIGFVDKLDLDKISFMANLTMRINKDIKLPKDSQAAITTSGFLGGKFIAIIPGGDDATLADNDQIKRTQSSVSIESLIGKLIYSFGSKQP